MLGPCVCRGREVGDDKAENAVFATVGIGEAESGNYRVDALADACVELCRDGHGGGVGIECFHSGKIVVINFPQNYCRLTP